MDGQKEQWKEKKYGATTEEEDNRKGITDDPNTTKGKTGLDLKLDPVYYIYVLMAIQ